MRQHTERTGMRAVRSRVVASIIVFLSLALASCASRPEATAIEKFSKAMDVTTAGMQASFAKVEEASYTADLTNRAANYLASTKAADPVLPPLTKKDPVVKSEDLQPRLDLLDGLATYAKLLGVLSGGELEKGVDAGFVSAGTQLQNLGATFSKIAASDDSWKQVWGNQLQAGTEAFSALGGMLVHWRAVSAASDAILKMHPHIAQITEFMILDLGSPEVLDKDGKIATPGTGLRGILKRKEISIQKAQENLLVQFRADAARVGLVKLNELFLQAEAKQEQWRRADAVLAEVKDALPKMRKAHEKLAAKESKETIGLVGDFVAQANKIAAAAERLTKQ